LPSASQNDKRVNWFAENVGFWLVAEGLKPAIAELPA
jgi:hypothetical protein